jgi:hypothetical protein
VPSWEDPIFPRLISRPVRVHWMGWETDTYKLQQAGWQISAEQSVERRTLRMCIKHRDADMVGLSCHMDMYHFNDRYNHPDNLYGRVTETAICEMRHMARDITVHDRHAFLDFKAIDAEPRIMMEPQGRWSLKDLLPFAEAPLVRTKALILPEAQVDDLLAAILERQADARTAYFKDLNERERLEMPSTKIHAQIISLSDHRRAA